MMFLTHSGKSQLSFTISDSLCTGDVENLTANTGTLSVIAYSWAALPAGAVFSSPSSANTTVYFNSSGIYTVALGVLATSGSSYVTNTVVVNTTPTVNVTSTSTSVCSGHQVTLTATGATNYTWSTSPSGSAGPNSIVVTPTNNVNNYQVVGYTGACGALSSVLVYVVGTPNVIIGATSDSVCPGFTSILSGAGALTYTWYPGAIVQPTFAAGPRTYTVIGAQCSRMF